MILTLISSVVLMSTSTTVQEHGGIFTFFFSDTDDLAGDWYSSVSAMTSLFCVSWWVFVLVHDIPMQFWIEKSLPRIIGLFKCSHTMNVWKNMLPFMLIHIWFFLLHLNFHQMLQLHVVCLLSLNHLVLILGTFSKTWRFSLHLCRIVCWFWGLSCY